MRLPSHQYLGRAVGGVKTFFFDGETKSVRSRTILVPFLIDLVSPLKKSFNLAEEPWEEKNAARKRVLDGP